jgi:predicted nucleic acid-binding protein
MSNMVLTPTGKLRPEHLPAMYLDSSVLIDYWMTEGLETGEAETNEIERYELPLLPVVRVIMKSEKRTEKVVEIRKKLLGTVKVVPVVSPLALLELIEWHAEAAFRQIASQASGANAIKGKGKKDIGDYLKRTLKEHGVTGEELSAERRTELVGLTSTGLEELMSETWLDPSFALSHGLQGLVLVDIAAFGLLIDRVWKELSGYAYLQLGLADIMHILIAQHLGCKYFASFDSDFRRVQDIVREQTEISLLTTPEEILAIL